MLAPSPPPPPPPSDLDCTGSVAPGAMMMHPVTPVGYEVILLRGGGKKKRRISARNSTYLCVHDLDKYNCSECHGSRLCEVRPFVLAIPVNHHHHDPAWRSLPTRPEAATGVSHTRCYQRACATAQTTKDTMQDPDWCSQLHLPLRSRSRQV
eukprot:CAMPEP_0182600944 /NCGR_PEP_ID=MMETSP1324-20130603/91235_1 /TAXON_ID=236786 /ORGANISM="Florenciella sp., Strain RCC1587" /LENGTH=151 /DNA_ID=CAMNT_0024818853 /DNA_START=168 /DNA_END=623 /DNA_ORIENTATION=-